MQPEGWRRVTLGEVAQIASGGTPDRLVPRYWNGDIPWVTTGEIRFNEITDTAERISAAGLKHSSAKLFAPGTLLMAMYGQGKTRGQVAMLRIEAATNQASAAIQLNGDCDADYVYQYLAAHYDAIRELGNAGSQRNLSIELIKEIPLLLPPKAEQTRIATLARVCDDAIATANKLVANSRLQKRAIMSEVLSGKRRVPPSEEMLDLQAIA